MKEELKKVFGDAKVTVNLKIAEGTQIFNPTFPIGFCGFDTILTLPTSVKNVKPFSFISIMNLTNIDIDLDNQFYCSVNGILFNKNKTEIVRFPFGKNTKTYTIPDSVISIGKYAFFVCTGLTNVTIPDSVTSIGEFAFNDCESLTSVEIGNSVTSIGDAAFAFCKNLETIFIPDSVTTIGEYAFRGCEKLIHVSIPMHLTENGNIDPTAFEKCSKLETIEIRKTI